MKPRILAYLWLGGLTAASLILYYPVSSSFFVSDDWDWLWTAAHQTAVLQIFVTNSVGSTAGGSYNPVISLFFFAWYRLFGLTPGMYHVMNIVLHATTAFAVGILCYALLRFFESTLDRQRKVWLAVLASIVYLVLPFHAEAVAWVSALPHIVATLFYVGALIMFLQWQRHGRWQWFAVSLLAALISLGAKEIAITLPLIIAVLALRRGTTIARRVHSFFLSVIPYIATVIVFLLARFNATGLFFGTYADRGLIFRPVVWTHTFLTFFEEFLTLGIARVPWSAWFFSQRLRMIAVVAMLFIMLTVVLLRHASKQIRILFACFLISILTYTPLGFSRITNEGARYLYLPAIFFIAILVFLVAHIHSHIVIAGYTAILVALCLIVVQSPIRAWAAAGDLAGQLVATFAESAQQQQWPDAYVIALPDTRDGAQVFRNNFREAVFMTFPEVTTKIAQIPVYIIEQERATPRIVWRTDDRGYFGFAAGTEFTGVDRDEAYDYIYELWDYDYSRFTSETVRLILKNDLLQGLREGSAAVIAWDGSTFRQLPQLRITK